MSFFSDDEKGGFDEFDNCTVTIVSEGTAVQNSRGAWVTGEPIVFLEEQGAQEWDLTSQQSVGLTGEEVRLRKNLRLHGYHSGITEKHFALVDGIRHNILLCGHDGSKSFSILLLRRVSG
jgi:hypothetical protein